MISETVSNRNRIARFAPLRKSISNRGKISVSPDPYSVWCMLYGVCCMVVVVVGIAAVGMTAVGIRDADEYPVIRIFECQILFGY